MVVEKEETKEEEMGAEKKRSDILDSSEGNKKQQVRKKKKNQVGVEGAWGGRGGSRLHERQMFRLAVEISRSWRDLTVKALNQTCINY